MLFPDYRPRRLRQNEAFRRMIRETHLSADDFILPLFAINGSDIQNPIPSMPGHFQLSVDHLVKIASAAFKLGVPAVMLFGIPESKDPLGTLAYAKDGIVQKAVRTLKEKLPDLAVITDVCLCQYTDHGHCGVVEGQTIDNDATLDLLARTALSHAKAGADMVAPSDMMDGRVAEIRDILDENSILDQHGSQVRELAEKYGTGLVDSYSLFREQVNKGNKLEDYMSQVNHPNERGHWLIAKELLNYFK